MESQVFRWLCVNVFEMWVWLSGASAFFVFERPVGALHAELAVEGEQRRVAVCSARICSSFLLLLRVSCSKPPWALLLFSLRYFRYLCLCLHIALRIGGLRYLCDISVLSMQSCARTGVCLVLSLCYLCVIYATLCWRLVLLCVISVLSLCYLYYLMLSLCYLPDIFWDLCLYSLLSLSKAWRQELAVPNLMVSHDCPCSVSQQPLGPKFSTLPFQVVHIPCLVFRENVAKDLRLESLRPTVLFNTLHIYSKYLDIFIIDICIYNMARTRTRKERPRERGSIRWLQSGSTEARSVGALCV